MSLLRILLLCISLTSSANALASVVYRWETETASPTVSWATGEIEIADWAWQAGHGDYTAYPAYRDTGSGLTCYSPANPLSPIIRMNFAVNSGFSTIDANFVEDTPLYGGACSNGVTNPWFSASFVVDFEELRLNAAIHDGNSDLYMNGSSFRFFSDALPTCPPDGCSGAIGRWVQVPAPGTIALLGAGMFGFVTGRRRNRS